MFRSIYVLMLSALLASPVAAQPVQPGQYVLLRNTAGQYLSAQEGTPKVYLSPNTAGWEQWQYVMDRFGGPRLVSFHGTILVNQAGGIAHVPGVDSDRAIYLSKVVRANRTRGPNWYFENSPPNNGDSFVLSIGERSYLASTPAGVGTAPYDGGWETPVPDTIRWTLTILPAWDQTRKPRKKALKDGDVVQLKSSHGTYIYVPPKAGVSDWLAMHRAQPWERTIQLIKTMGGFSGSDQPLTYGSKVYAHWTLDQDYYLLGESASRVWGRRNSNDPPTHWMVVDPTGTLPAGSRLTSGSKVCLRDGAMGLSADPGIGTLRMSPNCAAWEVWTIEAR